MQQPNEPQGTSGPGSPEKEPKVEHVRSPRFYFAHGDVVLSAKWDQQIDSSWNDLGHQGVDELWVYFRVEKAQLSCHSKVFADMFSLPASSDAMEQYDGVPLVVLPDEGHAVECLLKFIYRPHELQFRWMNAKYALRAKWALDIAAKYQVDSVRPFMIRQLTAEWPSNLFYWILQYNERQTAHNMLDYTSNELFPLEDEDLYRWAQRRAPDPASAVRMALDHDIPSILPAAFYRLCQVDLQGEYTCWDNDGAKAEWRFEHKEHVGRLDTYHYYESCGIDEQLARWDLVDRDSLYRLGLGKRALQDVSLGLTSVFWAKQAKEGQCECECETEDACGKARGKLEKAHRLVVRAYSGAGTDEFHKPDPLGRLWEWWQEVNRGDQGWCNSCADAV